MSFIPSSAMPHAKPQDEHDPDHRSAHDRAPEYADKSGQAEHSDHGQEHVAAQPQPEAPQAALPVSPPAVAAPTPSSDRQGPEGGKGRWGIAFVVAGIVAVGAATAVLFRGEAKPAKKSAKAKRKADKKSGAQ